MWGASRDHGMRTSHTCFTTQEAHRSVWDSLIQPSSSRQTCLAWRGAAAPNAHCATQRADNCPLAKGMRQRRRRRKRRRQRRQNPATRQRWRWGQQRRHHQHLHIIAAACSCTRLVHGSAPHACHTIPTVGSILAAVAARNRVIRMQCVLHVLPQQSRQLLWTMRRVRHAGQRRSSRRAGALGAHATT